MPIIQSSLLSCLFLPSATLDRPHSLNPIDRNVSLRCRCLPILAVLGAIWNQNTLSAPHLFPRKPFLSDMTITPSNILLAILFANNSFGVFTCEEHFQLHTMRYCSSHFQPREWGGGGGQPFVQPQPSSPERGNPCDLLSIIIRVFGPSLRRVIIPKKPSGCMYGLQQSHWV